MDISSFLFSAAPIANMSICSCIYIATYMSEHLLDMSREIEIKRYPNFF